MRLALDTSVIVSHFRGDAFSEDTRDFFAWAKETGQELIISDVVYAELYAGIYLSSDPAAEEKRVLEFLAVNNVDVRLSGSLEVAKRAGRMYALYLARGGPRARILPDYLIAAHAELYADALVTWNPIDLAAYARVPVLTPRDARSLVKR